MDWVKEIYSGVHSESKFFLSLEVGYRGSIWVLLDVGIHWICGPDDDDLLPVRKDRQDSRRASTDR